MKQTPIKKGTFHHNEYRNHSFDLEQRTQNFAKECFAYCRAIGTDIAQLEVIRQLTRSAGSVGANYIEANESLSRKDFRFRIKICLKEAKEARYWLSLSRSTSHETTMLHKKLYQEVTELLKIFSAILRKFPITKISQD